LASGALDVAGFLGSMFPGKGKPGKPERASGRPPKPIPKGKTLRFGGLRSIGIVNAIFTGLDFATGLQEGESVGKAAAGAGGSLAGSLLGGAIGQSLIPIPGVGFVIGSMAGNFLGGFAADRAYEGVAGDKSVEQKQQERLKAQEQYQKSLVADDATNKGLNHFSELVDKFSSFAKGFGMGEASDIGPETETDIVSSEEVDENTGVTGEYPGFDNVERVAPFVTGQVSTYEGAQFGAARKGGRIHAGQDISGQKAGDPVLATMAGTVVEVGRGAPWQKGGGESQTIGIKHKDGSRTRYVHVIADVSVGTEVKTGQQIGKISPADTWSSADFPHLHFELYAPGSSKAMDPRPYLKSAPKTPSIVPIKPGAQASVGPDATTMKFGALDIESAPVITIGDSIAKGVKDKTNTGGAATEGASPKSVLNMMQSQDMKGKLVRLSSGISNSPSDIATVRQQLSYAKSQGAKGVQLMGTSFDRADLKGLNLQLSKLAQEFPGFVQFTGGFKSTDLVHPNYSEYSQKMQDLIKGGMGGLGVDPSMIDNRTLQNQQMSTYPAYNTPGSTIIMPIKVPSGGGKGSTVIQTPSRSGGGMMVESGPTQSQLVNSLMKKILLTNLSEI